LVERYARRVEGRVGVEVERRREVGRWRVR